MRRLARLRRTALPIPRPATRPTRGPASGEGAATTVTAPRRTRRPVDRTRRKSRDVRRVVSSDGEALPSFAAAGGEDGSTGARPHTMPESVLALPAAHFGLIRSFHGESTRWTGRTGEGYGASLRHVKGAADPLGTGDQLASGGREENLNLAKTR